MNLLSTTADPIYLRYPYVGTATKKVGFTETPETQELIHNNYDEYTYLLRNISILREKGSAASEADKVDLQRYENQFLKSFKSPYENYLGEYYVNDNQEVSANVAVDAGSTVVNPSRVFTAQRFEQGSMAKQIPGAIPNYRQKIKSSTPDSMVMLLDMVDVNLQPRSIRLDNGIEVSAVKLFPNPESLTINSAKRTNRYNTMTRWVEEFWGDELDNVSLTGSTYSFFQETGSGLVLDSRRETNAHILLQELLKFYRLNGCLIYNNKDWYQDLGSNLANVKLNDAVTRLNKTATDKFLKDPDNARFRMNHPLAGLIRERLYIRIKFDFFEIVGYFESFDINEDSASPYRFTYSASFKVEKTKYSVGAP